MNWGKYGRKTVGVHKSRSHPIKETGTEKVEKRALRDVEKNK